MKDEFNTYLVSLDMTSVLIDRISKLYDIYEKIISEKNEEIEDIFVSEYIDKEGARNYIDLWFFTKKYFLISHNFIQSDEWTISYSYKSIRNLTMNMKDYDFIKATDKSRIQVKYVKTFPASQATLKASKENSDQLNKIFMERFLPNVL